MTPSWLTDLLAGLMLAVAGYCAARVIYARLRHGPTDHDVDVLHVFMGVAMAGMLTSRLSFGNSRIWEALFAFATLWFVVRGVLALRSADAGRAAAGRHVPYALASAAMLYMYLAPIAATSTSGGGSMPGMADASDASSAASRYPLLGLVLAVSMVAYAVLVADRTPLAASASANVVGTGTSGALPRISATVASSCSQLAPRAANCCHIAMSITMAYLLAVML